MLPRDLFAAANQFIEQAVRPVMLPKQYARSPPLQMVTYVNIYWTLTVQLIPCTIIDNIKG